MTSRVKRRGQTAISLAEKRAKDGRPTKLTFRVMYEVIKQLRFGANFRLAARLAGISYDSFNEYRKQGEEDCNLLDPLQFEQLVLAGDALVGDKQMEIKNLDDTVWTPFAKFSVAVERAQAFWAHASLANLNKAGGKGNVQAIFGQLARVFPTEYGEPAQNIRLGNPDGSPLDTSPKIVVGRLILPDNGRAVKRPEKKK